MRGYPRFGRFGCHVCAPQTTGGGPALKGLDPRESTPPARAGSKRIPHRQRSNSSDTAWELPEHVHISSAGTTAHAWVEKRNARTQRGCRRKGFTRRRGPPRFDAPMSRWNRRCSARRQAEAAVRAGRVSCARRGVARQAIRIVVALDDFGLVSELSDGIVASWRIDQSFIANHAQSSASHVHG